MHDFVHYFTDNYLVKKQNKIVVKLNFDGHMIDMNIFLNFQFVREGSKSLDDRGMVRTECGYDMTRNNIIKNEIYFETKL